MSQITIKWFDLSEYGLLVHKFAIGDKATGQRFAIVVSGAIDDNADSLVHLGLFRAEAGVYSTDAMTSEQLRAAPVMSVNAIRAVFPKLKLVDANPAFIQKNVKEAPVRRIDSRPKPEILVMSSVYLSQSDGTVQLVGRVIEQHEDGYFVVQAADEKLVLRRDDFAIAFASQFAGPETEELPERFLCSVRSVPAAAALDSRLVLLSSIVSAMPADMVHFAQRGTAEQFESEFATSPDYRKLLGRLQSANDVAKLAVNAERPGLYLIARAHGGADLSDTVVLAEVLKTALANPILDRQVRLWIDGMLSSHVKMTRIEQDLDDPEFGAKRLALLSSAAAFIGVSEYRREPEADLDIALTEDLVEPVVLGPDDSSANEITVPELLPSQDTEKSGILPTETLARADNWEARIDQMTMAEATDLDRARRDLDKANGLDFRLNSVRNSDIKLSLKAEHPDDLDAAEAAVVKAFKVGSSVVRQHAVDARRNQRESLANLLNRLAMAMDARDSAQLVSILSERSNLAARTAFNVATNLELSLDASETAAVVRYWVRIADSAAKLEPAPKVSVHFSISDDDNMTAEVRDSKGLEGLYDVSFSDNDSGEVVGVFERLTMVSALKKAMELVPNGHYSESDGVLLSSLGLAGKGVAPVQADPLPAKSQEPAERSRDSVPVAVVPQEIPAHVLLLQSIYESQVAQARKQSDVLDSLVKGYGYQTIEEFPLGLQKTARILSKAILDLDVSALKSVLLKENKRSRKAFENVFGNKLLLPKTDKGTAEVLASLAMVLKQVAPAPALVAPVAVVQVPVIPEADVKALDDAGIMLTKTPGTLVGEAKSGEPDNYLLNNIGNTAWEDLQRYGGYETTLTAVSAGISSPLNVHAKTFDFLVSSRLQEVREQLKSEGWASDKNGVRVLKRNGGTEQIALTPVLINTLLVGVVYVVQVERNDPLKIVDTIDRNPVAFARLLLDRVAIERDSESAKIEVEGRAKARIQEEADELQRRESKNRRPAGAGEGGKISSPAGEHFDATQAGESQPDMAGALGARSPSPIAVRTERPLSSLNNFRMSAAFEQALQIGYYDISGTIRNRNMTALRVLEQLEVEDRLDAPMNNEKELLALYSGWGAAASELARLDVPEKIALIQSTGSAFYTPIEGIDALWASAVKAGFKGGTVLEAGAGVGWMLARMPDSLRATSRVVAVEREPHAARILKVLHPDADVLTCDFKVAPVAPESVDLVIGNFPFGSETIRDGRYPSASLHDYFLMHSMSKLKPGGVMVVLTSTYTLDAISASVRQFVHGHQDADLLAAVRLPGGLFVGTEVAVDCLVLRRRLPNEPYRDASWVASKRGTSGAKEFAYNSAAAWNNDNFDTIKLWAGGSGFHVDQERFGLRLRSMPGNWNMVADQLIRRVPEKVWDTSAAAVVEAVSDEAPKSEFPVGYVWLDGGNLMRRTGNTIAAMQGKPKLLRVWSAYVPLRDAARAVLAAQLDVSDELLAASQAQLIAAYDQFVSVHGPVNAQRSLLNKEPYAALVFSLERYDLKTKTATKTEFFSQRTLSIRSTSLPTTPTDAIFASFDLLGRIDQSQIESWLSRPFDVIASEAQDLIIKSPETGEYELLDNYLSGDLHEKLASAQAALALDPAYQRNVTVLTGELGQMIQRTNISVTPGATWIPIEDYQDWVRQLYFAHGADAPPRIERSLATGRWFVKGTSRNQYSSLNVENFNLIEMVERVLNQQSVKVEHKSGATHPVTGKPLQGLDFETTVLVNEKLRLIERHFKTWVWSDDARSIRLEREYNLRFNTYRRGTFDASRAGLTIPGYSLASGKPLRPSQLNAVMRGMMCQGMLLGHSVGLGKTLTMAALSQKWRSIGMVNRSLMAVKKNTLWTIAKELMTAFPAATVLVAEQKDMSKAGRIEFLRKVQTMNPSVVLMTHGGFRKIRLPVEAEMAGIAATMLRFERAQAALEETGSRSAEVKTLGKKISDLSRRMERLFESRDKVTDDLTLAQLGIGALLYDEAQALKNLQVITAEPMLGIPTASSMRAEDALMKVDWLREQGCKIVFATGTPISNSLVECFNLQRFLDPIQLRNAGVDEFDAWKAQFATGRSQIEADPGASGYRLVTRLAEMKNVPELISMMSVWADVVTAEQAGIVRPSMSQVTIDVEPTPLQQRYRDVLAAETQYLRTQPANAIDDGINILSILGNARSATLDLATKYPTLPEGAGGRKIGAVAREVARIYKQSDDRTQAVFLDIATPKKKNSGKFDGYAALKAQLIQLGVKAEQICFIHDCSNDQAKAAMFEALNRGEKRICLGSTDKMGEGSNFQQKLIAIHHVNATYNPAALTQRNGRIERFGNTNLHVQAYYYVTRNLLEDWNWSLVRTKQGFIDQIMNKLSNRKDVVLDRIIEEDSAVNVAAIEAAASGNPLIKRMFDLESKLKFADALLVAREGEGIALKGRIALEESNQKTLIPLVRRITPIAEALSNAMDNFSITIEGISYSKASEAGVAIYDRIDKIIQNSNNYSRIRDNVVGVVCGQKLVVFNQQLNGFKYGNSTGENMMLVFDGAEEHQMLLPERIAVEDNSRKDMPWIVTQRVKSLVENIATGVKRYQREKLDRDKRLVSLREAAAIKIDNSEHERMAAELSALRIEVQAQNKSSDLSLKQARKLLAAELANYGVGDIEVVEPLDDPMNCEFYEEDGADDEADAEEKTSSDIASEIATVSGAINYAGKFMGISQRSALKQLLKGEEGAYFKTFCLDLAKCIHEMPVTYEQKNVDDPIAYLHYFSGASDWFILEKDIEGGVRQAFGYACLNGDYQSAELGYISIQELANANVELDFHFNPTPLSLCKARIGKSNNIDIDKFRKTEHTDQTLDDVEYQSPVRNFR